jgi:hypothetical protein
VNAIENLYATLIRIIAILVRNDSSWAKTLAALATEVVEAHDEVELQHALRRLLSIYGGMGSFNDVILQSRAGVSPDNDALNHARSGLYSMVSELIR